MLELFEDEELVEGLDARERGLVEGGVLEEVLVDVCTLFSCLRGFGGEVGLGLWSGVECEAYVCGERGGF